MCVNIESYVYSRIFSWLFVQVVCEHADVLASACTAGRISVLNLMHVLKYAYGVCTGGV